MNAENIFSIANMVALAGWILLAVAPRWTWTRKVVISGALPLALSVVYLILIILFFGRSEGGFDSLPNVMLLFTNKYNVLAGWVHYLAFDLFVGAWEVKDAQTRGVSHWFVVPCLFLTFMLGPIGLLAYHIIRLIVPKRVAEGESL